MRAVPGLRDPLVTYRLTRRDRALLGRGLARLALLMLEAGATEVYPSYRGAPVVRTPRRPGHDAGARSRVGRASVMTVHLCSTVPLGEVAGSATDSYGLVRGTTQRPRQRRLAAARRARASTRRRSVMAVAIRNARHFVDGTKRAS